jgi:replication factor C subunit 3/5
MALWVDKYRPHSFDKMELHTGLNTRLKRLAESGDLPHLMFCGPSGAGKKTRILALLRELYGVSAEKVKAQQKVFNFTEPKATVELTILSSANHIELTPADAGSRDSLVVQSVIKEIAASVPITDNISGKRTFRIIVLNEVDRLSRNAQHALVSV